MMSDRVKGGCTMWRNRQGQSMAEYALLVVIVTAAFVGMQTYYKRSLQAKIKGAVDAVNKDTGNTITQYEPYYASSTASTTQSESDRESYQQGGQVSRNSTRNVSQTSTRTEGSGDKIGSDAAWK